MALEIIQLENIPKHKTLGQKYKRAMIIFLVISFFITIFARGEISFFWFFLGIFAIISIWGFVIFGFYQLLRTMLHLDTKKLHRHKESALVAQGFNVKFSAIGLLVDVTQQKLAFTLTPNSHSYVCNFSDVRSWYAGAYTQEKQYQNTEGAYAGSRTMTLVRYIVVRIADAEYPEMRFAVMGDRESELWIARLDALING